MSVNKVILVASVGKDPEVRMVGEAKVATFSVATNEKYKDSKSGEWKENTEWHNIVCWRNTAEIADKYIKKGTQLYVEGKLMTRSWEDNNGVKRYQTDVVASTLQLLGRKESSDNRPPHPADSYIQGARQMSQQNSTSGPAPHAQAQQPAPSPAPQQGSPDMPDDDLPF